MINTGTQNKRGHHSFSVIQARSHNETNEAPKISKKNLPQMKNS